MILTGACIDGLRSPASGPSAVGNLLRQALMPQIFHRGEHPAKLSGRTTGFVERTVLGIVGLLKQTVESDAIAAQTGFLQQSDPRLKSLSVCLLLAAVLFSRSLIVIAVLYALTIALALASSIRPGFFLKRTLLFVPIFAAVIAIPALFSAVTPGEAVVSFPVLGHSVSITRQGIGTASVFFLRVLGSVSLAVLLVLTTRHHILLKVLRIFKVPALFVMITGMCYRYIFLFLDIIQNTFTAIKSRVGYISSSATGRRIATTNMAGLWLRSYRMQTQVYSAMLARGYGGEPQVFEEFHAHARDWITLAFSLLTLIGTLWLNRFFR
jgi:cobalt/nickel transport system permease protein